MDVIGHHTQFDHEDVMSFRHFVEDVLAKLFILLAPKHVVSVLGAPFKVVEILAYAMASAHKIHDLFAPGQVLIAPAEGGRACPRSKQISFEKR